MILRPRTGDHKVIGKYTGKIIVGVGLLACIPLITSLAYREWSTALDFALTVAIFFIVGFGLQLICRSKMDLDWSHALVVASGSWILATVLGAIPYWLSGHYSSYLDCMFDVMSGYTTTGLYLLQDLDHASYGLNMWRHLLTFAGGQGIVVIALTFLLRGTGGAFKLYAGEGKDERLVPNVVHTARAIWIVSLIWLAGGTAALGLTALWLGEPPNLAFLDGMWITMGGWSTGGFAPMSYNTSWFHSLAFELLSIIIFIAGSLNFALHWAVWTGDRREIRRNLETVSFAVTMTLTLILASFGLAKAGLYPDALNFFRKAFYQVASGHTTTGFGTIYSRAFVTQWGPVGMVAVTLAMAIGASACSTAGGIKGIRVGLIVKTLMQDLRRLVSPESAVVVGRYHHIRDSILENSVVRSALTITVLYVVMYGVVSLLGLVCGYDLVQSAFEGISAGSNTGLSCGVTAPSMPDIMKAAYIIAMWLGRLEFMSVLALGAFAIAMVRGK